MSFQWYYLAVFLPPLAVVVFLPIELLGGGGKEHIAAAVESGFDGVLDDTDDEADSQHDDIA